MASPDKGLSGISIWLSLALLAGVVVMPFLPGHKTNRPTSGEQTAPIGSVSGATKIPDATKSKNDAVDAASGEVVEEAWTQAELTAGLRECLALLAPISADIELAEPIKKGACGSPAPLELRGLGGDKKVTFRPAPKMNCRLAASLSRWVETVLQPAARKEIGSPVTRIVGASSYSCRNIYNNPKLSLSEHATGNAIDIVGFVTADGRNIKVLTHWG
ncbi:MAG: extensin family protein, partial [Hyphomicrobium sp.]